MKRVWKRGIVWILAIALLVGVLSVGAMTKLWSTPTSQTTSVGNAETAAVVRNMNLKTQSGQIAGVTDPAQPTDRQSEWDGSRVYFGTYGGSSMLFRVLDAVTSDYAADDTKSMFLDSEAVLVTKAFDETENENANKKYVGISDIQNDGWISLTIKADENAALAANTEYTVTVDVACDGSLPAFFEQHEGGNDFIFSYPGGEFSFTITTDENGVFTKEWTTLWLNKSTGLTYVDFVGIDIQNASGESQIVSSEDSIYGQGIMIVPEMINLGAMFTSTEKAMGVGNAWQNSDIRAWLNSTEADGFLNGFSALEQSAVIASTRAANDGLGAGIEDLNWTPLAGDKVFALDANEVTNPAYGFSDTDFSAASRVKKIGTTPTYWWLRSNSQFNAGSVYADGNVFYANTDAGFGGVSPAMNVDLSKVLFASAVWNYGATCMDKTGTVAEVGTDHVEENTWKLTLTDETKKASVTKGIEQDGTTVTVPYTYSGSDVTQLSVMITTDYYTSDNAEVLYYGKLTVDDTEFAAGSGIGTFTLPKINEEEYPNYKLYLLAEDVNNGSVTDYASVPTQIIFETGVFGDANGDEVFDARDLVRAKRYLADTTVPINYADADVNSDGYVDDKDPEIVRETLVGNAAFTSDYNTVGKPTYNGSQALAIGAYCGPRRYSNGIDYLTNEQFKTYADAGFNFVISEHDAIYGANYDASGNQVSYTDFESSNLKQYMDLAKQNGVDVIVESNTLSVALESGNDTLSDAEKQELAIMLQELSAKSNFKGLFMSDEPGYQKVASYNAVTEYLKTLPQMEGKQMYVSLFPYYCKEELLEGFEGSTHKERYKDYLSTFSSMLGLTNYDFYPFLANDNMYDAWFENLEMAAVNAYGATDSGITIQALSMTDSEGTLIYRPLEQKTYYSYQLYSAMAYGMKNISYFTYWQHWGSGTGNEVFANTMINSDGTVNDTVYNAVKAANDEVKKFDHVYMDFTWQGTMKCAAQDADGMLARMSSYNSPRISNLSATNDAIVGCLKDSKGYDGFMLVNATDPADNLDAEVTVTFRDATKAIVYIEGEETEATLDNGVYKAKLTPGQGVFVIPYIE